VVRRFRIDPRSGVVEATITDGEGFLRAQWPIRPPTAQLGAAPGRGLILEGIARLDQNGEMLMVEPAFEILPGPTQE
jgi:hypothetical protein